MNNPVVISGLVLMLITGCSGQDERSYDEPHRTGTVPETVRGVNNPDYFTTEQDMFHPDSMFESIRKKSLTDFGFREVNSPVSTPTANTLRQAVIDEEFDGLMVTGFKNYLLQNPAFPFDYENDIMRLKRLAEDHGLYDIVDPDSSEIKNLTALMLYTSEFLKGGTIPNPDDDRGPSAEYITRRRREDNIGGESRHYAALFCQLALATGFNARLVGMHAFDENGDILSHTICEVFVNSYVKWVAFDPFSRATFYVREGVPQSALELRNIMLDSNYRAIRAFPHIGDITTVSEVKEDLLPRYRYLYIWRMNDILSKSPANGTMSWQALYETHLVWEDSRTLVSEGRFDEIAAFNDTIDSSHPLNGVRYVAHVVDDMYWRLNYVMMDMAPHNAETITAYYTTVTPNFKEYLIEDHSLINTTENSHTLEIIGNIFMVNSVNQFDMTGVPAWVDFSM